MRNGYKMRGQHMAKVNREFLVPYLEDVCALYMADLKICAKLFEVRKEILILQYGEGIEERKRVPNLEKKMARLSIERNKIAETLSKVYAANIIPSYYRDMYAAVYLYDFFSTSRSDDLDMALNTYVLEQTKDKLDVIIEKQHTEILNQRRILAYQQKSLEEQRAHNAYMRQKVYQIASNIEEQNQYLAMVESSAAATAYTDIQ